MLSTFHFALNVMLVRALDPAAYGIFALAFVAAVFGSGLSNALAATPLSVYATGIPRAAPRLALETTLSSVNLLLTVVVALVTMLFVAAADSISRAVMVAAFAAAWTLRHYSRSFAFARRMPEIAVLGDAAYLALSVALLTAGWFGPLRFDGLAISLVSLAVANFGAACLGLTALGVRLRPAIGRRVLRRYGPVWRDVRWSLVGVVTSLLQMQAHSLIVSLLAGPAAYAPLAAGQILFGPVRVAVQAWQMVARPELALAVAENRRHDLGRALVAWVILFALGSAVVGLVIVVFWSPLEDFMYAQQYAEQPMGWIVGLSGFITLFFALASVPSCVLQAFRAFRLLAMASLIGAALSLTAVTLILLLWPPVVSLAGLLLAEVFVFAWCLSAALRQLREP